MNKVTLRRRGHWRNPWVLQYGVNSDCVCSYASWQEAVWDLDHAFAVTFPERITACRRWLQLNKVPVVGAAGTQPE